MKPTRPNIRRGGTYPPEFREEAVRYWLSSGQTLAAVTADLGLTPETLPWRKQLESSGSPSGSSSAYPVSGAVFGARDRPAQA